MPAQTTQDRFWFGEGSAFEVSTDGGSVFNNYGAFAGGITFTHNYDKEQTELGNRSKTCSNIKNQTFAVAPTPLATNNLEQLSALGGGIYNYTATAGTPVAGATQVTASGDWAFDVPIVLNGQNASGLVPTINSVTGSVDGPLVDGTDYIMAKVSGGWAVIVFNNGKTLAQSITTDYDYTPASGKTITAGSSSIVTTDFIIRVRHYTDAALTLYDAECLIHKASLDSGIQFNWKGVNEDGLNNVTMALTGDIDDDRADGDQLFSMYQGEALLTSC
jgi:hypothetical protein